MNVYLVRQAGTTAIHGIFWASRELYLVEAISEMGEPWEFEVCQMKRPGGVWHDKSFAETPSLEQSPFTDETLDAEWVPPMSQYGENTLDVMACQSDHVWWRIDRDTGALRMVI